MTAKVKESAEKREVLPVIMLIRNYYKQRTVADCSLYRHHVDPPIASLIVYMNQKLRT